MVETGIHLTKRQNDHARAGFSEIDDEKLDAPGNGLMSVSTYARIVAAHRSAAIETSILNVFITTSMHRTEDPPASPIVPAELMSYRTFTGATDGGDNVGGDRPAASVDAARSSMTQGDASTG